MIVGIDPGIKVGFAALDLNGKLVASGCTKQKGEEKIISMINQVGIPSLIATDTNPAPRLARKIAARFNVKCHRPNKSLTKESKRIMGGSIQNPHIRDAYSAALKAYRKYQNRFKRIDYKYPDKNEQYKHLILKGVAVGKLQK